MCNCESSSFGVKIANKKRHWKVFWKPERKAYSRLITRGSFWTQEDSHCSYQWYNFSWNVYIKYLSMVELRARKDSNCSINDFSWSIYWKYLGKVESQARKDLYSHNWTLLNFLGVFIQNICVKSNSVIAGPFGPTRDLSRGRLNHRGVKLRDNRAEFSRENAFPKNLVCIRIEAVTTDGTPQACKRPLVFSSLSYILVARFGIYSIPTRYSSRVVRALSQVCIGDLIRQPGTASHCHLE